MKTIKAISYIYTPIYLMLNYSHYQSLFVYPFFVFNRFMYLYNVHCYIFLIFFGISLETYRKSYVSRNTRTVWTFLLCHSNQPLALILSQSTTEGENKPRKKAENNQHTSTP